MRCYSEPLGGVAEAPGATERGRAVWEGPGLALCDT